MAKCHPLYNLSLIGPPGSTNPLPARPCLRFYHDDGWMDTPFVKAEQRMEAFLAKIKGQGIPTVVIEIGRLELKKRFCHRAIRDRACIILGCV